MKNSDCRNYVLATHPVDANNISRIANQRKSERLTSLAH